MNEEYPSNWHSGIGEVSRPLCNGGYYQKLYYRQLPGSNQYTERFLQLTIDTLGSTYAVGPQKHVLKLEYCTEDRQEVYVKRCLESEQFSVDNRNDADSQAETEADAMNRGFELMQEYSDWSPDE
jgi:hypothetical protein